MSEVNLGGGAALSAFNPEPETLQGYLAHKKQPPPHDHHRALGIALL